MKYVYSAGIGIVWLVGMVFGTADVWQQGWGEVLLMWFTLSLLCALALGAFLTMNDAIEAVLKKFQLD